MCSYDMLKAMDILIRNKKAGFNFELLEEYDAGLELQGHEVKSLRKGRGKLEGAHIVVRGNEAYLVGATIEPYQPANTASQGDTGRPIRLLLTRKEINVLLGSESQKGLTIVPIVVYNNSSGLLKLRLAIARGKKKADKRETIRKRDTSREIARVMKERNK